MATDPKYFGAVPPLHFDPQTTRTGRSLKINMPVPCNSSSRSKT